MTSEDTRPARDSKLWLRLLLVGLTGSLPLFAVSLFLIDRSYSGAIHFGEQEMRGNAVERPLELLLQLVPRYQLAARRSLATPGADPRTLSNARSQLDQVLSSLSTAYGSDPELASGVGVGVGASRAGTRLKAVQMQWQELERAPAPLAAHAGATAGLMGALRDMIRYVGDRSNLILDDDLDSYYLMDITLCALPQTQQRLADVTLNVADWLRSGQLSTKQTQIALLAATLREADLERITRDAHESLDEDDRFNGVSASLQANLPPAVERLAAAERPLLELLDRLATGEAVPVAELESAGWAAHDETFHLFDVGSAELDRLLAIRLRGIENTRLQGYALLGLTLALAGFAMALNVRSLVARRHSEILANQEVLRAKEMQLRALGDNLPGGVVYQVMRDFDGAMRFLYVSAGIDQLNGVSAEAALADSETLYGQILPEDRAPLRAAERRSLTDQVPFHAIARMRRSDGTIRHMEFSSAPRLLPDGRAVWDGIQMDVTDRQLADASIKQSEQRFSRIFENSPMPITLSSFPDGRFIAVNDRFLSFSGFTREEVIGHTSLDLNIYQDKSQRPVILEQLRLHRRVHGHEQEFRTKSGAICQNVLWIDIITIDGSECVLTISLDVTEQRRAERQQKELEEQLRQTQKLEALGTLAGGIAHDFNNILGAIISYTELSRMDSEDNSVLSANLDEVLRAGARATNLVRQILSFSRQQKEERRHLQLAPIVKEALSLLRATLPSTIALEPQIDRALPDVFANPTQMHQIIMNLCTNSAHAMSGKQGQLSVELGELEVPESGSNLHVELKPGRYVRMTVRDTGRGMDAATAKRIFEPFFTTKPSGEGTGLGLSVVHGIVKEYGGVVMVDSELGCGTSVSIYLPASAALEKPAPFAKAQVPRGNGERILFVDDEAVLGDVAQKMMQRLGYQATVFQSAQAALANLQSAPEAYDALITDLTMPAVTGIELARQALAVRPSLPIILVSGSSGDLTATELRKLGIRELLSKPLDYGTLARVLSQVLQG